MDPQYQHRLLDEIDARQDEVITQLDDLNEQIEAVIRQIVVQRTDDSDAAESGGTETRWTSSRAETPIETEKRAA